MDNLVSPNAFFSSLEPFEELFQGPFVWQALLELEKFLSKQKLGKIETEIPSSVHLENKELISIGKGTVVEPCAYIRGPCIIGKNCTIRHGAYVRGFVLAADHVMIGHDTEVKHAILLSYASAAHFAYVGDSILGSHVNLGAGVKCANFRLDKKEVPVQVLEKKFKTGLGKLGAIIGDETQVGCNSVLNPGTLIGKKSICYPLMNIHGYLPENSRLKARK